MQGSMDVPHLDDDLHQVLLCNHVAAVDDLLENVGQDDAAVHVEVDAVELAQSHEVGANEDPQLTPLHLAALAVARQTRMLQADPELVHLDEVGQDEAYRVVQIAAEAAVQSQLLTYVEGAQPSVTHPGSSPTGK